MSTKATVLVSLGFLVTFVALLVLYHQAATISGPEALQNKVLADPADPTKGWTFSAANALTGRFGTFLHGNSANRTYITLDISGAIPMLVSSQTPPSDTVCAVGADKFASLTCNNGTGTERYFAYPVCDHLYHSGVFPDAGQDDSPSLRHRIVGASRQKRKKTLTQ